MNVGEERRMRLIDASELIQVLCVNMDSGEQFDKATHCVDVMPTVDAVPVRHGKWKLIRMEDNGDGFYTCSNCDRGDIHSPLVNVPYCWYCGARMDEE